MQLVPIASFPKLQINAESIIAALQPDCTQDLNLGVRIPNEFIANHFIIALRLKQG